MTSSLRMFVSSSYDTVTIKCKRHQSNSIIINQRRFTIHPPTFMAINIHECALKRVIDDSYHLTKHPAIAHRCHFLLFMTVVMACLTTTPALSISLFERPLVTHTFRAGCGRHSFKRSFGVAPIARGIALRRVMRTPFARACHRSVSDYYD